MPAVLVPPLFLSDVEPPVGVYVTTTVLPAASVVVTTALAVVAVPVEVDAAEDEVLDEELPP